jgi:hypothetical protein
MKTVGIQWRLQDVAQINSTNLKENYEEDKTSRVGAKIWWTFWNQGKNKGWCL